MSMLKINIELNSYIIDNVEFSEKHLGEKVYKLKHKNMSKEEFLQSLDLKTLSTLHLEQRAVLLRYISLEDIVKSVKGLVKVEETIIKNSYFKGEYPDTYTLYGAIGLDFKILEFKDTSTDRKYFIYLKQVDAPDPISAIASCYNFKIKPSAIETIYRHGDLLLGKISEGSNLKDTTLWYNTNLSKEEYLKLVKYEA